MATFQIRIDNQNYEGSPSREEAEYLFKTVEKTCLKSYDGKEKSLVKIEAGKEEIIKKSTIKIVL